MPPVQLDISTVMHNIMEKNDTYESHFNSAVWLSSATDGQETRMHIGIVQVLC